MFLVAANLVPGVHVGGLVPALFGSFIYAMFNTVLTAILGIDSGDPLRPAHPVPDARASGSPSDRPGLVIIQIDGLAHPILAGRMRAGSVTRWPAVSATAATSSALAGDPAVDDFGGPSRHPSRQQRRDPSLPLVRARSPAPDGVEQPGRRREIVRRVSNGEGLLSNNGASICNLVTGDATRSYLTTAAIKVEIAGARGEPGLPRLLPESKRLLALVTLFVGEFVKELIQARRTRRSGIRPQMHRGLKYAGMRAASNVLLRDVDVSLIIEEMYRGANVIYADFTDYDELAHHCGPERVESFEALDGVDRRSARSRRQPRTRPGHIASSCSRTTGRASARPSNSAVVPASARWSATSWAAGPRSSKRRPPPRDRPS